MKKFELFVKVLSFKLQTDAIKFASFSQPMLDFLILKIFYSILMTVAMISWNMYNVHNLNFYQIILVFFNKNYLNKTKFNTKKLLKVYLTHQKL